MRIIVRIHKECCKQVVNHRKALGNSQIPKEQIGEISGKNQLNVFAVNHANFIVKFSRKFRRMSDNSRKKIELSRETVLCHYLCQYSRTMFVRC